MNNELFRKVEARLYDMYKKIKMINCLKRECESLQEHADMIMKDIKRSNISIEAEMYLGIDYSSINVQTSHNGDSYMDRELIAAITRLENEWRYVRRKLIKKHEKIREIERSILTLKNNIEMLSEENKRFIELKYGDKRSIPEIADMLNMGRTTAYRKREELISDIAQWC
ncbi:hypothetical protein [Clostridium cylindrosporum]|uniref:Phage transcriptional regulator, RinA family n=1 Tax=Clostridium cylindrosporum DSM 605 TaxID=1121307 RepID=A0A0J8DB99_CLOCY|nr:hypothetical protein [Clostridium cylindrosporum]KMT21579.1 hypothetical protein CLCY_2c03410 [Clostridium cylindrosporum DSM 605]